MSNTFKTTFAFLSAIAAAYVFWLMLIFLAMVALMFALCRDGKCKKDDEDDTYTTLPYEDDYHHEPGTVPIS